MAILLSLCPVRTKLLDRRKRRVSATHTAPRPYVAKAPRDWQLWGMPWPQFHCDRRVVLAEQLHISVLNFPDSDRIMPATVDSFPPIDGGQYCGLPSSSDTLTAKATGSSRAQSGLLCSSEGYCRAAYETYSQPSPSDGVGALVATSGTVSSLGDLAARRAAKAR